MPPVRRTCAPCTREVTSKTVQSRRKLSEISPSGDPHPICVSSLQPLTPHPRSRVELRNVNADPIDEERAQREGGAPRQIGIHLRRPRSLERLIRPSY